MQEKNEPSLWKEYKEEKDEKRKLDIKNKLIEKYYPLIKKIARSLSDKLNRRLRDDELTSFGVDGLYIAIDRFDENRGVKFESYASFRIRGSMMDNIRRLDTVPRSVRINNNLFELTKARMESEQEKIVSDYDVIKEMGLDDSEFLLNMKYYKPVNVSSLDGTNLDENDDYKQDCNIHLIDEKTQKPDFALRRKEFFNKLLGKNFSDIERKIIYMYYYDGFTMDVIAEKVGLSESRVSQLHTIALPKLKDKILRNPDYFSVDISNFVSE